MVIGMERRYLHIDDVEAGWIFCKCHLEQWTRFVNKKCDQKFSFDVLLKGQLLYIHVQILNKTLFRILVGKRSIVRKTSQFRLVFIYLFWSEATFQK